MYIRVFYIPMWKIMTYKNSGNDSVQENINYNYSCNSTIEDC